MEYQAAVMFNCTSSSKQSLYSSVLFTRYGQASCAGNSCTGKDHSENVKTWEGKRIKITEWHLQWNWWCHFFLGVKSRNVKLIILIKHLHYIVMATCLYYCILIFINWPFSFYCKCLTVTQVSALCTGWIAMVKELSVATQWSKFHMITHSGLSLMENPYPEKLSKKEGDDKTCFIFHK